MDDVFYYKINDLNLLGKIDDYVYYIFDKTSGWQPDAKHILSDRLFGYDETEEIDSPYRMGNPNMLSRVEQITEEEANKIISQL